MRKTVGAFLFFVVLATASIAQGAASFSDMWNLSQDSTFQDRVQSSLLQAGVAISNEGFTVPFHRERAQFFVQILASPTALNAAVQEFTATVATDANCIADATQGGTVVLTASNRTAQAALVTDAHIAAAVSAEINAYIREPGN